MKELQTVNCLVCGKPAETYSGHVHKDKKKVTAGFCGRHPKAARKFSFRPLVNCKGCYGEFRPSYGLMTENIK